MTNANNYSAAYASAIVAGTPGSQMKQPNQSKRPKGFSLDALARMGK